MAVVRWSATRATRVERGELEPCTDRAIRDVILLSTSTLRSRLGLGLGLGLEVVDDSPVGSFISEF
jgi:hypothetical protein